MNYILILDGVYMLGLVLDPRLLQEVGVFKLDHDIYEKYKPKHDYLAGFYEYGKNQ
jgi:hypothetical protein